MTSYARWVGMAQIMMALLALVGFLTADNPIAWLTYTTAFIVGLTALMVGMLWRPVPLPAPIVWVCVLGLYGFFLWGVWAAPVGRLPRLPFYFAGMLVWPILSMIQLALLSRRGKALVRALIQFTLMLAFTVLLLEGLLRLTLERLPYELVTRIPYQDAQGFTFQTNQTIDYVEDQKSLDLYRLTCLGYDAEQSEAPYPVHYTLDENGFRGTTDGAADLVAVGDSFTLAARIPEPYWMITPRVYALGLNGAGPLEAETQLKLHGYARSPRVVVMAYFEGNDLQDTWSATFAPESQTGEEFGGVYSHFRPLRFLAVYSAGLWLIERVQDAAQACVYPLEDANGHQVAFYPPYVSMATLSRDTLATNPVFLAIQESLLRMQAESTDHGAAFVVMYIPDKFTVHRPALDAVGALDGLAEHVPAFTYSPSQGFVADETVADSAEIVQLWRDNGDAQRESLAAFAAQQEMLFLDLTDVFREAAAEGQNGFAYGDTHWNRAGHQLAGATLRAFLDEHDLLGD